jgi:uncharacterized membrane protein YgcG
MTTNAHCTMHGSYVSTCPGCVARKRSLDEQNHAANLRAQNELQRRTRDEEQIDTTSVSTLTLVETLLSDSTSTTTTPDTSSSSTPDFSGGGGGGFDGGGASGSF